MIYDRTTMALVHSFILGGVAIGELELLCCLRVVYTVTEGIDHYRGTFLFSIMPLGHNIAVEPG
jgi:hypothetical protein